MGSSGGKRKQVAVSAVNLSEACLSCYLSPFRQSSVYCFYDPEYRALALGKLTALKETEFVKEVRFSAWYRVHGSWCLSCFLRIFSSGTGRTSCSACGNCVASGLIEVDWSNVYATRQAQHRAHTKRDCGLLFTYHGIFNRVSLKPRLFSTGSVSSPRFP